VSCTGASTSPRPNHRLRRISTRNGEGTSNGGHAGRHGGATGTAVMIVPHEKQKVSVLAVKAAPIAKSDKFLACNYFIHD
jgi:hypothetical protein